MVKKVFHPLVSAQPGSDETASPGSSERSSEVWLRINAFLSLKSSNTQRTYLSVIKEWCEFLGTKPGSIAGASKITGAKDIHAIAYKAWLEKQPGQRPRFIQSSSTSKEVSTNNRKAKRDGLQSTLSNATIAKKFSALRRIYRMLMAYDFGIDHNPFDTDRVPAPRAKSGQKRPTEMIDFEKVAAVLSLPDTKTAKGRRDKAILSILFGGGLRRSEVVGIRIGDLKKTSSGTFYVRLRSTKAGTDAEQALPAWCGQELWNLREKRLKSGAELGNYLFVSFRGQAGNTPTEHPLSDSGLYKLFKRYVAIAGAGSMASPHSARATAITRLLEKGLSHRDVQEFSRHASVQMVETYDKRRIGIDQNPAKNLDYD